MKITGRSIFRLTVLVFTLLLTVNWMLGYFFPSCDYPFNREGEIVPVYPPSEITNFVDVPFTTKANIEIYFEGTRENVFTIKSRMELFINSTDNFSFFPVRLLPVENAIKCEVIVNNQKLDLFIDEAKELVDFQVFYPETNEWKFEGELKDYYFTPSFEVVANNVVNEIETSFTVRRSIKPSKIVSVPLFFKDTEYARKIKFIVKLY